MPLTRTTRADVAAYALALAGRSRDRLPVPWTASAVMDDCAAFCSHVLWGGKPGPILWVDNFKTAGDGTYAAGASDLAPWDVLLFDWEGNGVGNHVEFMVGDLGNGTVRTYGANGSDSREARYRTRPKRYIMGRFRPTWTTTLAPPALAPAPSRAPVGDIVTSSIIRISGAKPKLAPVDVFLVNPDEMKAMHLLTDVQVGYWELRGVPTYRDVQPRSVIANFQIVGK